MFKVTKSRLLETLPEDRKGASVEDLLRQFHAQVHAEVALPLPQSAPALLGEAREALFLSTRRFEQRPISVRMPGSMRRRLDDGEISSLMKLWNNPTGHDVDSKIFRQFPVLQQELARPLRLGDRGETVATGRELYVPIWGTSGEGVIGLAKLATVERPAPEAFSPHVLKLYARVVTPSAVTGSPDLTRAGHVVALLQGQALYVLPPRRIG